jgi:NAD-dependent deacetylase
VDTDDLDVALERAADSVRRSRRMAVLTGAGVSAESGLATFRGAGGLWEGHPVEDVATPFAFQRDPTLVWRFYNARRSNLRSVQPNPGHRALVALEEHFARQPGGTGGDNFTLITQNVDGLHQSAGSRHVLELHGSLRRVRCMACAYRAERDDQLPDLPRCACGELLRPDVVWFHETLPEDVWRQAAQATADCQCFLVVGTSAVVYPAAGLIDAARDAGAAVIEVNPEATTASRRGGLALRGPSGHILPQLVKRISGSN